MPKQIPDTVEAFRMSTINVLNSYINPPLGGIFKPKRNDALHAEKLRLATALKEELEKKAPQMNQAMIMQAVADLIYANKVAVLTAIQNSGIKNIIIGGPDKSLPHDEYDGMIIEETPSKAQYKKYYSYGDLHQKLTQHLEMLQAVHAHTLIIQEEPQLPPPTEEQVKKAKK